MRGSYFIGDRHFPWLARFFGDPRGREPRHVSDDPIQTVIPVSPASGDMVVARLYASSATLSNLFWTTLSWQFAQGAYADGSLPNDRLWKIMMVGGKSVTNAVNIQIHPRSDYPVDGLPAGPPANVDPSWQITPGSTYYPAIDALTGLLLPFGGNLYVRAETAATNYTIIGWAIGYPHGSTDIP